MVELPYDVVHSVLSDLSLSQEDIQSFCLLSKAFVKPAQRRLFEVVGLGGDYHCKAFNEVLDASPHLIEYIGTLRVTSGFQSPHLPPALLKVRKLQRLVVGGPPVALRLQAWGSTQWAEMPEEFVKAVEQVLQRPSLIALKIQNFSFPSPLALASLLGNAHRGFDDLALCFVSFDEDLLQIENSSSTPAVPLSPLRLTLGTTAGKIGELFETYLSSSQSSPGILNLARAKAVELVIHGDDSVVVVIPVREMAHFTHELRISVIGSLPWKGYVFFDDNTTLRSLTLDYSRARYFPSSPVHHSNPFVHGMVCLETLSQKENKIEYLKLRWRTHAIPMSFRRQNMPERKPNSPSLTFAELWEEDDWEMNNLADAVLLNLPRLRRLEIDLINDMTQEKGIVFRDDFETFLRGTWQGDGVMGHLDLSVRLETD